MPIEWTEKKTTEERKQLRVAPVVRALAMEGVTFASADTHPATLDDLSAAIRGMTVGEKESLAIQSGLDTCWGAAGDLHRYLTDARTALESTRAEVERLRAKLEARNQELDNQKAEIDRLKANQIPIEVEPEWVRRMPEWMKVVLRIPLGDTDSTNPIFLTRDMIRSLLNAQSDLSDKHRDGYACGPLRLVARDALRAAYLARKAGGE